MSLITPFLVFKDVPCSSVHFLLLTQSVVFFNIPSLFQMEMVFRDHCLGLWGLPKWFGGKKKKKIHLPMQETWVWSLGEEDPLEKEMATHSSIVTWKIPRTEEPGGLQSMESQRVGHDWAHMRTLVFIWNLSVQWFFIAISWFWGVCTDFLFGADTNWGLF